jgi:competence protein ComEC
VGEQLHRNPAVSLFLGVVLGLVLFPHLQNVAAAIAGLACAAFLLLCLSRVESRLFVLIALAVAAGLIAAERAHVQEVLADTVLGLIAAERFVVIEAPVDREWLSGDRTSRVRVRRFAVDQAPVSLEIRHPLTIYVPSDTEAIEDRDHILAEGFLRRSARGSLYLSVKSRRLVELSRSGGDRHPRGLNRRLFTLLRAHASIFPEHERATALIAAIALGDGSLLPLELKESYRRGGTYHLLVFSGLQIAFAAGLLSLLLRVIGLRAATDVVLLVLAISAPVFAAAAPAVSRASLMIGLYALSRILGRPTRSVNLLFLSAALRLLLRPEEISSPGFLLTYAATFGLVVVGSSFAYGFHRPFARAAAFGLGAELCTQPVTLIFFRHYVAGGFLVTLVIFPLLATVLLLAIPIFVSLSHGSDFAAPLIEVVAWLDRLAASLNAIAAELPLSGFAPAPPVLLVIVCFAAAAVISRTALAGWKRGGVLIAVLLIPQVTVAWRVLNPPRLPGPVVEALDVGQGDSILVRGARTILIDGGGSEDDPEFGRRELLPLLIDRHVRKIDILVMSHPHADHCGGLVPIAANLEVGEIWISARHLGDPCTTNLLEAAGDARVRFVRDGQRIEADGIAITATIPRLRYKKAPLNNGSVVLTIEMDGVRLLLTGDIEADAERTLAEEAADRMPAEILKVAHHGSRSSTTPLLLEKIRPRVALISCGEDNSYGHPAAEVLERLRESGAHVFRTDRHGSVRITPGEGRLRVESEAGEVTIPLTVERVSP